MLSNCGTYTNIDAIHSVLTAIVNKDIFMHGNQREALAYIAGIIDGEGSIIIQRDCSVIFMKNRKRPHFHACIRVGMINREPLDFILKATGLGEIRQEKPYHHKRPMFRYLVRRKDEVLPFLDMIKEFLLVKHEQAKIVYEFFATCINKPGIPISDEIHAKREELWMKNRTLNGVVDVPATTERRNKGGRAKGIRIESTV